MGARADVLQLSECPGLDSCEPGAANDVDVTSAGSEEAAQVNTWPSRAHLFASLSGDTTESGNCHAPRVGASLRGCAARARPHRPCVPPHCPLRGRQGWMGKTRLRLQRELRARTSMMLILVSRKARLCVLPVHRE